MIDSCLSQSNSTGTNRQSNSNDQIAELQAQQSTLIQQASSILAKVIEADNKLLAVIRHFGLLFSCSDLPPDAPSGTYNITKKDGTSIQVYCDMNRTSCSCNTTGGWMRVANLDMTDPNQNCPAGFRLVNRTSAPLRTCGRPGPVGCVSTTFQTYGVEYSHVCGRLVESLATRINHQMHLVQTEIEQQTQHTSMVSVSPMGNHHDNTSGHLLEQWKNKAVIMISFVNAPNHTILILEQAPFLWARTTSVTLETEGIFSLTSILMIYSGMVRDVGVPALAVSLTIHHGSASNSLSRLLMISN